MFRELKVHHDGGRLGNNQGIEGFLTPSLAESDGKPDQSVPQEGKKRPIRDSFALLSLLARPLAGQQAGADTVR
ncbi:MAG: hypothetical protein K2W95_02240 [Candidatus Obscuribacterales bacterium]|nr:hypothetical protein [Candidatus Obscuribacterales bacterium]